MSRESCFPYQDNLAAYSLSALDSEEIAALDLHLKTCKDCQEELADYGKIASGLLNSVPQRTPPARLRDRLAGSLPSAQKRTPGMFAFSFKQVAALAVWAILIGLNLFSMMQIRSLQEQQIALSHRLAAEQATIGMLAGPGTQLVVISPDLPDLTGTLLLDRDKNAAVLVLWNLPELEVGRTYQIWLINAQGEKISAGLFGPSNGQAYTTASLESSVPIGRFIAVGVTVEPSGGSDQPTGTRILVVNL